jgi:hypothetical protein
MSWIISMVQYSALLILPEVSTERQYVPPSLLLMNAELMSCRWSQLSQLSEM